MNGLCDVVTCNILNELRDVVRAINYNFKDQFVDVQHYLLHVYPIKPPT